MTCSLKMKPWKFGHLLALIFPAHLCGYCSAVEFRPCVHAVKNEPCNMTCLVPDFSKLIEFQCNGSTRASCSVFVCPSNMIKEGGNTMYLQIPSLSYTNDNCDWTCSYGGSSSPGSNITIYSGYSITPSLTSQQNADVVNLTATAECLYPSNPNVVVQYKEQGGQYISLSQLAVELQSSNGQGGCSFDIENRITAISDVSGRLTGLGGKSVFFRMKFLQYSDAMPAYTNAEGPFYFNKSSSKSEENESGDEVGKIIGPVIVVVVGIPGAGAAVYVFMFKKKEEQSEIDPQSRDDPKVKELIKKLLDWINKVLADYEIIVEDIAKDISEGEILQKLIEKLAGEKVNVPQSETDQKQKLQIILTFINRILQESSPRTQIKWSVDSVNSMNLVAILHLLVALAKHYRAPIRLPENVSVNLVVVTKQRGKLDTSSIVAEVINPVDEYVETRIDIEDGDHGKGKPPKNTGSATNKNAREKSGDSQNNTGSKTTKTATERVGSPASASNVKMESKLHS